MGKLDWHDLEEASRRYTRLRRRYWRWHLYSMLTFLMMVPAFATAGALPYPVASILVAAPFGVVFLVFLLGSMITWSELTRFPCPRCGRRFIMIW